MTLLGALWHLLNLFAPAVLTALLAAAAAKLLWRRELAPVAWRRLVLPAAAVAAALSGAGLLVLGQDGRLLTYGAIVLGCALTLWWQGFVRRR